MEPGLPLGIEGQVEYKSENLTAPAVRIGGEIPIETTVILGSELSELSHLMEAVTAFCGEHDLGGEVDLEIQLVLEEAVTNSMRHGFVDDGEHSVEVRMAVEGKELVLEVTDDGIPFNPLERAPVDVDAPIEERTVGGLGIHLIRNLMDEVDYDRVGNGNRLRMIKSLG